MLNVTNHHKAKPICLGLRTAAGLHILGCQRQAKPAHWTHVFRVLSLDDFICLGENTLFWTLGHAHLGLDKSIQLAIVLNVG